MRTMVHGMCDAVQPILEFGAPDVLVSLLAMPGTEDDVVEWKVEAASHDCTVGMHLHTLMHFTDLAPSRLELSAQPCTI